MRQLTTVAAAVCLAAAACGGGNATPPKTINVSVTHRFFSSAQAGPGDTIVCGAGTGSALIPSAGGVRSSTGIKVTVRSDGKIEVWCPAIRAAGSKQPTA